MKTMKSFRLADSVIYMIEELVKKLDVNKTAIIELAILEYYKNQK